MSNLKELNHSIRDKEIEMKNNKRNDVLEYTSQIKQLKKDYENIVNQNTDLKINYNSTLNQVENLKQMLKDKDNMLNSHMNLLNNFTTNHNNNINNNRNSSVNNDTMY
jgi:chromosome segregation ATPase